MKYFLALIPGILAFVGNYLEGYFLLFNIIYILFLAPLIEWFKVVNQILEEFQAKHLTVK